MYHVVQELIAHGRNGDDTLMHVSRDEVGGLRAIARAAGTDLTFNPKTGLPEAFNLGQLLGIVAPIAVGAFAGPEAGMALGAAIGAGTNPNNRALGALAGGIGGYSGAGLGSSLAGLGATAAPASDLAAAAGSNAASAVGPTVAGDYGEAIQLAPTETAAATAPNLSQQAFRTSEIAAENAGPNTVGLSNRMAGINQLASNPNQLGSFVFANQKPLIGAGTSVMMNPLLTQTAPLPPPYKGGRYRGELYYDENGIPHTRAVPQYAAGGLTSLDIPKGVSAQPMHGNVFGGQQSFSPMAALLSNPNFQAPRPLPPASRAPMMQWDPQANPIDAYLKRYQDQAAATPTFNRVPFTPDQLPGGSPSMNPSTSVPTTNDPGSNHYWDVYGGAPGNAGGGLLSVGQYIRGPGDGMSDSIPAQVSPTGRHINVTANEYVVPADVVSHLGNGSSDAGARVLDQMGSRVRAARTGNAQQARQINPNKFMPA